MPPAVVVDAIVGQLALRPGHEMVRTLVHDLCVYGLGRPEQDVAFEVPVPTVHGRLDAVFGTTIFEFKRDLRQERGQAEEQLTRYLSAHQPATGQRYLGIATDGATFTAYELGEQGLVRMEDFSVRADDAQGLMRWLDTAVTVREDLPPSPDLIRAEFGRDSLVLRRALGRLRELWVLAEEVPEATLKRDLWHGHLEFVYGTLLDPQELFLHHTYLTLVAKSIAVRVITPEPLAAGDLLDGTPFVASGIGGTVEMDFFDWVRLVPGGQDLTERLHRQVARFRMEEIDTDVLKALYENLIDANQRHYLGEYYTPDWLAQWVCTAGIPDPLATKALDPACGSGTFLFHAVRRYVQAAERADLPLDDTLEGATRHVMGLDVHPVAVLFARVTYLLALGRHRLARKTRPLNMPVYLGDALQWDVEPMMNEEHIVIRVPQGEPLVFPGSIVRDPVLLEKLLHRMDRLCSRGTPPATFRRELTEPDLSEPDRRMLVEAYTRLKTLHDAGRNHIWKYIIRNLTRPLWLSQSAGRPDALIGNPPWLKFNAMSTRLQEVMRRECKARGLWVGGNVATHQDLSAYFLVRAAERYLHEGGRVAFVMPKACLDRRQYQGFRSGHYGDRHRIYLSLTFRDAWVFDNDVQPLFPVPSTVLFVERTREPDALPETITRFEGRLPGRDLSDGQARTLLSRRTIPWPQAVDIASGSPYRADFRQGAQLLPRRFFLVRREPAGPFGANPEAPAVRGRTGSQDKAPWRDIEPFRGPIERQFLRPALLGDCVAPFRVLDPELAIIPWNDHTGNLMDAATARLEGYPDLADWLGQAEQAWTDNRDRGGPLLSSLDHYGKLSRQLPCAPLRVVYTKSGKRVAAALVRDAETVIDHKPYWTVPEMEEDGRYLCAILNSETLRGRVEHLQSRGAGGARDFDKVLFSVPFPRYDDLPLHRRIAELAETAEGIAAGVNLPEGGFKARRAAVRQALDRDGVAREMEESVVRLFDE